MTALPFKDEILNIFGCFFLAFALMCTCVCVYTHML